MRRSERYIGQLVEKGLAVRPLARPPSGEDAQDARVTFGMAVGGRKRYTESSNAIAASAGQCPGKGFFMVESFSGDLVVKPGQRFALVVAEFNRFITAKLAEGAVDCLLRHGAKESQLMQVWVPGCFEVPVVARELAKSGKYAAVICLGCVIRGETGHYDHVAGQVASGVGAIGAETGVPAMFGVITADTVEQALNRTGLKSGNTGWNAAMAAIATANVMARIKGHE